MKRLRPQRDADDLGGPATGAAQRHKRWLIEAGLIVAFWTVLALLTLGNDLLDPRGPGSLDWNARAAVRAFSRAYLWALLTPLVFWLCRRLPLDEGNGWRNAALHLGLAFAGAFVVDLIGDILRHWLMPGRAFHPGRFRPFRDLLELDVLYELMIYLAVTAAGFARSYFLRLREREARAAHLEARADRLQRQLTEARLQALRMQLNPHFLFNTLHAVSTLVGEDPQGVRRMIARLSELLRYVLEEAGRPEVPLRQELQFLRTYLEIMRIRFQGRLETSLHADADTEEALVPNLILQPLVENATRHGAGETEGMGRVDVRARREGDRLVVTVRDNGPRFAEGETPVLDEGTGLKNVRARLEELHGAAAALVFRTAAGGGLIAEVTLPHHTPTDLHTQPLPEERPAERSAPVARKAPAEAP